MAEPILNASRVVTSVRREAEEDWGALTAGGTTRIRPRLMFRYCSR
jgi:hypothetical protein